MSTPDDFRRRSGMGAPNETMNEMVNEMMDEGNDEEDRTSRMGSELPPLPVETQPGYLRLVQNPSTLEGSGATATDELIGRRCGGYVIEALLGEGGMGKVYVATNPRMGKRVAVKVLIPQHSWSPHIVDRFLQEAKAAAQIDDPNIVDVLDASELEDGRAYLLMPFVDGTSLEELCERMVMMPLEIAASILFQICGGLDAAHQHGIIHRDIKPQNILVGPRQHREHFVRIVDFGIAKLLDPHLAGKFKTRTKALMGTPGYMAPEQARGERNVDARADVYAVAVVAYRMLTGRRPYMDESLYGLMESQARDAPFPRPRELRPDIPIEWDEAIMAALRNDRARRLATVRELALRLARGIPDGDPMLRALAPRLAESPLPPNAPTLDPFLDHDIARRAGRQRRQGQPRRRRFGFTSWQLASLVVVLLGLGGIAGGRWQQMQTSTQPAALDTATSFPPSGVPAAPVVAVPPTAPSVVPSADPPSEPVVARQAAAPDSRAASERAPSSAATGEGRGRSLGSTPARPGRSSAAEAPPIADGSGSAGAKSQTGPLSRDESARLARVGIGMLIVNAQPWAQITINGKLEGYTPRRKKLPAGRYVVRMTKDDRHEEVGVTVSPGKVTTIERSFR